MSVELRLSTAEDAHIVQNLWPLYQHDLSRFEGTVPNRHGIFNDDDATMTLAQHAVSMEPWWKDPSALFPYLILVDGAPAGFNLIAGRARLPKEIPADFVVHEFFLLHPYRGGEVAESAALQGFDRHRGRWEVVTQVTNARAIAFWRRAIGRYTSAHFSEAEVDHPWGRRVAFRFDLKGELHG
ncbi:MAG: GNAT family N-acetyltransferase [Candidatus Eisenbacteria bacterium]|nr:GNAT family N-acetyltransferase [Candidatus Eisenbacteria bacterium]